jgi:probable HAF family extracellular repeat protein
MRTPSPRHAGRRAAALLAASITSLAAHAASYTLVDLGLFRVPVAINDHGDVAAQASKGRVLGRRDGRWHRVADGFARPAAINGHGDVTGDNGDLPMLWRAGKDGRVLALPGHAGFGSGSGVNDARKVVGTFFEGSDATIRCFQWTVEDGPIDIGFMGTGNFCAASDVNNAGQITGGASAINEGESLPHAFLFEQGVFRDLGVLPGASQSQGNSINDKGDVAGAATVPPLDEHFNAVVWPAGGGIVDLDPQGMFASSIATGINDAGEVVGTVTLVASGGRQKAVRFDGQRAVPLESEVPDLGAWTLDQAAGVNKQGEIVGVGIAPDGRQHGFLLRPR